MLKLFRRAIPKAAVAAIHEADVEAVLGEPIPESWACCECGSGQEGLPAGWLKVSGVLRPMCMACLSGRAHGWTPSSVG